MRVLAYILALCALACAQDPEGFPTRTTTTISAAVTPKTWAQTATTRAPVVPSYSAPSIHWSTLTSGSIVYQVAVTPTVIGYSTITTGGGVLQIPITSAVAPTIIGTGQSLAPNNTHKTRTIVLSVIFSFVGAVALILAAMFFMRLRAQRRMRNKRSWAMRPGGWIDESKQGYPMDPEINLNRNSHTFTEPQVAAPAPSHTRQRSL